MELANPESISYSTDKYSSKLISWTARGAYVYKDRYMATATGRYDGSSRFGENNKWGFFPSVGLGWKINQEAFLKDWDMLSNLKVYTSLGITGNQEIDNYASLSKLTSVEYIYGNSPIQGFIEEIGNPDLKWEKTTQFDIGVEIGLWDRVDITADFYQRNTTDLLYEVPIPTTSGYSSMLQNIGEVENKGVELSISTRVIDRSFKWDVSLNMSINKNQVVKLYGDVDTISLEDEQGIGSFLIVGQPVTGVWARESAGIITSREQLEAYSSIRPDAQLGEEMYVDRNADGTINSKDYKMIGTTDPNIFYGISTRLQYKNFALDVYGYGATKTASESTGNYLLFGENQVQNRNYIPSKYAYDRMWSTHNPEGVFPRAGAREVYFSDRTHGDRRYFIVKNIKLSYAIRPTENINWFNDTTLYVNAQNYFCFSNFRGYNPENGDINYPLAKALIFGIKANF
jgi:TonB-linked SusC/RagA family outer membrane protein